MPPAVTVTLAVALGLAALWGMRSGWRHRGERTAGLVPALPPVPADGDPDLGAPATRAIEATYVSSTVAGDWLERVVAHDLGVRSGALVQVFDGGVRIERDGAADLFVPAGALRDVRTAPGMAGKYVGGDGLVVLTWQAPGGTASGADGAHGGDPAAVGSAGSGTVLDTGLRVRGAEDRATLLSAARGLVRPPSTAAGSAGEPE